MAGTGYMRDYRASRLDSFDPLRDLPHVLAWYDFSTLSGADGTAITRVADKSGLGHDLIQPAASKKPTKQTGADGKPVARFAATQLLQNANFGASFPSSSAFAAPITIVALMKASSANTGYPSVVGGIGSGGTVQLELDATATKTAFVYGGSGGSGVIGTMVIDDNWHAVIATADTGAGAVYVDGYLSQAATATLGTDGIKSLNVGAGNGGAQFLGDLRAVMIVSGRLKFAQITALTSFLAAQSPTPITVGQVDTGVAWEQTVDANGTAVRIFSPRTPSTPRTLLLWSHPASSTEQIAPNYWAYPLFHGAMANGWYIAASNQHGDPWGNTQGMTDIQALDTLMGTRDTFTRKILVGASMGGLTTTLLASAGSIANVVGCYLIDAVLSLAGQYNNLSYTSQIDTAYGITAGTLSAATIAGATSIPTTASFPTPGTLLRVGAGTANVETVTTTGASTGTSVAVTAMALAHASADRVSDFPTKTAGHDPLLKAASSYATRMRFTASTSDTNVLKSANTDPFRALVATTATESALVVHPGPHLTSGAGDPADFVAFVKRCIA